MAFVSIGELAGTVLLKAESVRAARNETAATNLDSGLPQGYDNPPMLPVIGQNDGELPGEESESSPAPAAVAAHRLSGEETREPDGMKKAATPFAWRDVAARGGQHRTGDGVLLSTRGRIAPELKLVSSIGLRGIRPRGFPASLPCSPMLVIVGGTDHARSSSRTGALDFRPF